MVVQLLTSDTKITLPECLVDLSPEEEEVIINLDSFIFPHTLWLSETLRKWVNNSPFIKKIITIEFTPLYTTVREFIRKGIAVKSLLNVRTSEYRYTQHMIDQQHLIKALKFGEKARKHGNFHEFLLFSQKWNEIVDENIAPTSHMWHLYNEIQQIYRAPLRRFRYNYQEFERLKVYQDLEIDLGTSGFPPRFFEE